MKKQGAQDNSSSQDVVLDARIRGVGMQTAGLLEELKLLSGPVSQKPPDPRRIDTVYVPCTVSRVADRRMLPNRFLRRRYRELLGRIPILSYSYAAGKAAVNSNDNPTGKYEVSLATNALSWRIQHETAHSPELDAVDLAWFKHGSTGP